MRHPKATEQDCKIDAVLVAKAVMDVYPKEVARIKLVLNMSNADNLQEITVTTGDVKAFATGTISKEDLLMSLELKKVEAQANEDDANSVLQTEGAKQVAPGPFRVQRQLLAGRIEKLKARGTGTQPFEEMLAKIETDVQKPRSEEPKQAVYKEIRDLDGHLYEQEEAIREAEHIADGTTSKWTVLTHAQNGGKENSGKNEPSSPGPKGNGSNGWKGSSLWQLPEINTKINQMERQGLDVSALRSELQRIHDAMKQHDVDTARKLTEDLNSKLPTFTPNRGGR
jgi:hypothetical protein